MKIWTHLKKVYLFSRGVGAMRWLVWFVSYGPFSSLLKSYAKNAEGEALKSSSIFYGGSDLREEQRDSKLGKVTSIAGVVANRPYCVSNHVPF